MNKPVERSANQAVDSIQERLTSYACGIQHDGIPPEAVHAAKMRIIDTFGALIAGFFDEPSRIARSIAADDPRVIGATVIGTRMRAAPDIAAFANGTTSRSV